MESHDCYIDALFDFVYNSIKFINQHAAGNGTGEMKMKGKINARGKCTEVDYLWNVKIFDPQMPYGRTLVSEVENVPANCSDDAQRGAMSLATGSKYPAKTETMTWKCNGKTYECLASRTTS